MCLQEHLIENEVAVLRRVKHPNIIMLIEEVDTSSELYLVMELVKVQASSMKYQYPNPLYLYEVMDYFIGDDTGRRFI